MCNILYVYITYIYIYNKIIRIKEKFENAFIRFPSWKDQKCPFRTNPNAKLRVLPTLVRWGTQKRLEGDQLLKPELIEMLLTDGDD